LAAKPGLNTGSAAASRPAAKKPDLHKSGGSTPSRPGAKLLGLNNGSHSPAARHHPKLGIISGAPPDSGDEE
jgi:hypothetical protein